jgi:hypothetical protein
MIDTSWRDKRGLLVIALAVILVCSTLLLGHAKPPDVADIKWNVMWQTNYMNVHFWYDGDGKAWNQQTLWAYGMYVLNVYDWSYLFGWYGLGWDKLSNLNKAPSGKLDMYFYTDTTELALAWGGNNTIRCNLNGMGILDTSSHNWASQALHYGNTLSHESSHNIFGSYLGKLDVGDNLWLTEALAYNTGSCLWAWGKGDWDKWDWKPVYSKDDIAARYKASVKADGGTLLTWSTAGYRYQHGISDNNNTWDTFHVSGYFLFNGWSTEGNTYGTPALLVQRIKSGNTLSNSWKAMTGYTMSVTNNSTTDKGDFYYYFYHYWWG